MKGHAWLTTLLVCALAAPVLADGPDVAALDALNRGDVVAATVCAVAHVQQHPFSPAVATVFTRADQVPTWWLALLRAEVLLGWLSLLLAGWTLLLAVQRRPGWRRWWSIALTVLVGFGVCWAVVANRVPLIAVREAPVRVSPAPEAPARQTLATGQFILSQKRRTGYALLVWPDTGWVSLEHLRAGTPDACTDVSAGRHVSHSGDVM